MTIQQSTRLLFAVSVLVLAAVAVKGDGCDDTVSNVTGNFSSPDTLPANATCTYKITRDDKVKNKYTTIVFQNMDLKPNASLKVYEGKVDAKNLVLEISPQNGNNNMTVVVFNKVAVFVYKAESKDSKSSWLASFDEDECNVEYVLSGPYRLNSPAYKPGIESFSCVYSLANMPVYSMLFVGAVSQLSLANKDSSFSVTQDSKTQTFHQGDSPDDIFLESSNITLQFNVSKSNDPQLVTMDTQSYVADCSKELVVDNSFTLAKEIVKEQFPQYRCRTVVSAKTNTSRLMVIVNDLDIVETGNDRLTLANGGRSIGEPVTSLQTGTKDFLFLSSSSSVMMGLQLGDSSVKRVVNLTFTEIEYGGYYSGEGKIEAGAKPDNDVLTLTAMFHLEADKDKLLKLELNTPLTDNATLKIYRGFQESSGVMASLDSSSKLTELIGTDKMLLVLSEFPSNKSFSANFSSVEPGCDSFSSDEFGRLVFTPKDNSTKTCSWTVYGSNPIGLYELSVETLDLGDTSKVLIYSSLDKKSQVAELTAADQAMQLLPQIYLPTHDGMRIEVESKDEQKTSVVVRYRTLLTGCGGDLAEDSGMLESPNYPNQYPLNSDCQWSHADQSNSSDLFFLSFTDLSVLSQHSLTVSTGNDTSQQLIANYSGSRLPADLIFPVKDQVKLQFTSPSSDKGKMKNKVSRGLQLQYWNLECGGNITVSEKAGNIVSPNFPKPPSGATLCVWILHVPRATSKDSANIISLNITVKGKDQKKIDKILTIYDGASLRNKTLATNDSKQPTSTALSREETLVVLFNYTDSEVAFNVSFIKHTCGKKQLCDNGICMHADWICNGIDDCGDNSDERKCVQPVNPPADYSGWVKKGWVAGALFIGLAFGAILMFVLPRVVRRLRRGGNNYNRMSDTQPVV